MTASGRIDRRSFLVGAGAMVGAMGVAGCEGDRAGRLDHRRSRPPDSEHRNPAEEAAILDLAFQLQEQYRLFEIVSPAFVAVSEPEPTRTTGLSTSEASPPAPFAAVELDVLDGSDGAVVAGLAALGGERVVAYFDPSGHEVGIELRRRGQSQVVAKTSADLAAPFRFAFVLCENRITVLTDRGAGWTPLLSERKAVTAVADMRREERLTEHRYAWGARPGTGTVRLAGVRAGLFGMAGIRDQHLVQYADGTPYVRDGKAYFTATCAGLGFFQQAHWGVFTLDLEAPTQFEQVGQLYSRRGGMLLGDHAGQVVRDEEQDRWIVATSSWGDFSFAGVHVRHVVTGEDVLRGVHVLDTVPTPLPTQVSAWDPGMTRIDGRWHVCFVESPSQKPFDFHPALAVAPEGADWNERLELVGAATDLHQCEGPIMAEVDGERWLLASDGDHRVYPVFDMQMKRLGELDAPYGSNIPHPQLVPLGGGEHLMMTFDGTQYFEEVLGYGSHGDVLVMRSRR